MVQNLNMLPVSMTETPILGVPGNVCFGNQLIGASVGIDATSGVLGDTTSTKDELNEVASISSDQLLGLEEMYCDTPFASAPHTPVGIDELGTWVSRRKAV